MDTSQFAVIGLGVFGRHVAINLARLGHQVVGIDSNDDLVNAASDDLDAVVRADGTDEAALRELGLERIGCAVVAIGAESVEASILTTAVLRQIGVPRVVARSVNPLHARVLRSVGAHEVVQPEEEMGARLARRLAKPNILEQIDLGSDADLAEIEAPADFDDRSLTDLDVRRKFGVTVVAVRRGSAVLATFDDEFRIRTGDSLIVIGSPRAIDRLAARA